MLKYLLAVAMAAVAAFAQSPPVSEQAEAPSVVFVKMATTAGDIIIELDSKRAPITVANFLKYADSGAYEGTIFHRVIPWFVVQGGGYTPGYVEVPGKDPIRNEWNNGLKNVRGTIAMAREAEPDSAMRQFYINVADNPKLDTARPTTGNAGYAVFGRVVAGMDVVDEIRDGVTASRPNVDPKKAMEDTPVSPVTIARVTRLSTADALALAADAKPGREPWRFWRFDEPIDGAPTGFRAAETAGKGSVAVWKVEKPAELAKPVSPPAALRCVTANSGSTYNLLFADDTSYKDLSMTVRVRAGTGDEDQGGGVVWRAKDADNYYVARWNPIEGNFRLYHVKAGKRTQLGTAEATADPENWHRIRIDHVGNKITATFDGTTIIAADDSTFTEAGKIGLWTKADAGTWFDDLAVTVQKD